MDSKKWYERALNKYWSDDNWRWYGEHDQRFCRHCGKSETSDHQKWCKLHKIAIKLDNYTEG